LDTLKHIVIRYTGFVWAMIKPLGSWGVFVIAAIDSAFFGFPLDPVVAGYVYQDRSRFLLYAGMAAAGSAVGCIILYVIGYKGGEILLEKRISRTKFNKIRSSFERHEFWALMLPAMIPPPFPFKVFVLAASVFEMNFGHFLLAIFLGRLVRFLLLSVVVLKFGPQVVAISPGLVAKHWLPLLLAIAATAGLWGWVWYRARAISKHQTLPLKPRAQAVAHLVLRHPSSRTVHQSLGTREVRQLCRRRPNVCRIARKGKATAY
jgi:membrane protein YqaA with SNARE-associated domain